MELYYGDKVKILNSKKKDSKDISGIVLKQFATNHNDRKRDIVLVKFMDEYYAFFHMQNLKKIEE